MRKTVSILSLIMVCSLFFASCEQEDVKPQYELDNPELTERDGSEPADGGVRPKKD